MQFNTSNKLKNGRKWILNMCLFCFFLSQTKAQHCTHDPNTPINISISGQTVGAGITTTYVLTNATGVIQYQTTALPFTGVAVGNYLAHAVTWTINGGATAPNLTVGTQLSSIGGTCLALTEGLPINVCTCNNQPSAITFSNQGTAIATDETEVFVLTNATGTILATAATPNFTAPSSGRFDVYSVRYKTATPPASLTVGQGISLVNGSCTDVSQPLRFQVCASVCPVQICVPIVITKMN